MKRTGVITTVIQLTECMVAVPNANGIVCICVDLTKLNESVKRETHPLPAVDQTLAHLAGTKLITKLVTTQDFGRYHYTQHPLFSQHLSLLLAIINSTDYPLGSSQFSEHFQ